MRQVVPETSDAVSIALDIPPELAGAFAYSAGQFLTFRVVIGGRQELRSYSMSSSPEVDDELVVTVKRVAGGAVSNWIADSLGAGDVIEATRPAGSFQLRQTEVDLVAFAGGSGITPIFSLLKTALSTTRRRVRLLYANQGRDAVIFAGQLEALASRYGDRLVVTHHFDTADGFPDGALVRRVVEQAAQGEYYICGPGPFMDLVETTLRSLGTEQERIHIERFTPAVNGEQLPQVAGAATTAEPARVTIEIKGKVSSTEHRPGTTILQVARQMGMSPPFSCEAGDCATCMAKLIDGRVQMRTNNALMEDEVEEGWILTCQSVPDSASVHVRYEED